MEISEYSDLRGLHTLIKQATKQYSDLRFKIRQKKRQQSANNFLYFVFLRILKKLAYCIKELGKLQTVRSIINL